MCNTVSISIKLSLPQVMSVSSSSNSSTDNFYSKCQQSIASNVIFTVYTFISSLLLPLYILVLYMGVQRWRCQRSVPAGTSPTDVFTYHIVIVEICGVLGSVFYILSIYIDSVILLMLGVFVFCITLPGQNLFHCLACVEHYLAVVHPITYLQLREAGRARIRSISIGCVWCLCFGWVGVTEASLPDFPIIPFFCLLAFSVIVVLFCCLSVLNVLTHPGPGEVGGHKERVDQSKQRAFHIITVILGVLLLKFVTLAVCFGLHSLQSVHLEIACALTDSAIWLTLPSSLVLPVLFLHRAGKLTCCRQSTE